MDAVTIDKITSMVKELNSLNDRRFQDYGELKDIYIKQVELNKALWLACSKQVEGIDKQWLSQHTVSEHNVSLIPINWLIDMIEECVKYNNDILHKIMEDTTVEFDKEKYTPEKNIDMVEVLQMCYENVSLVLKFKGKDIPNDLIYSGINISSLSIPELHVLYEGVKTANDVLKGML